MGCSVREGPISFVDRVSKLGEDEIVEYAKVSEREDVGVRCVS